VKEDGQIPAEKPRLLDYCTGLERMTNEKVRSSCFGAGRRAAQKAKGQLHGHRRRWTSRRRSRAITGGRKVVIKHP